MFVTVDSFTSYTFFFQNYLDQSVDRLVQIAGKEGGNRTKRSSLLNWDKRVRIACEAAKGLEYLHEKAGLSVVHRNIKSSNILIFEDFSAKIADFELLNPIPDLLSRVVFARLLGPFGYHAPE